MMWRFSLVFCLLVAFSSSSHGDWSKWHDAYKRGDYASILKEAEPLVKQYDHDALFWLGWLYEHGKGVEKNDEKAFLYYAHISIHYENPQPIVFDRIAFMILEGRGGAKSDPAKAAVFFRKGAENGYSPSQVNLGIMYKKGDGVPQNYTEAVKWFRKGAENGSSVAMTYLGQMYYFGDGVIESYTKAHMWFNLASAHGDTIAPKLRSQVASYMTSDQIAKAQNLAFEWMQKNSGKSSK